MSETGIEPLKLGTIGTHLATRLKTQARDKRASCRSCCSPDASRVRGRSSRWRHSVQPRRKGPETRSENNSLLERREHKDVSLASEGGGRRGNKHNEEYDEPVTSRRIWKIVGKRRSEVTQHKKDPSTRKCESDVRSRRGQKWFYILIYYLLILVNTNLLIY